MKIECNNLLSDHELILRLKANDGLAFEQLYHRYKNKFAANFIRLLKSETLAEDFLHDLFVKVWENRSQINAERSFQAYLYRIAENMVVDFFRKASRDHKLQLHLFSNAEECYSHIEEQLVDKERKAIIDLAINELSPQCRLVFTLCKVEGRSYDEVSKMLKISPNTISNHLIKAKKQLKGRLQNQADWVHFSLCLLALMA